MNTMILMTIVSLLIIKFALDVYRDRLLVEYTLLRSQQVQEDFMRDFMEEDDLDEHFEDVQNIIDPNSNGW